VCKRGGHRKAAAVVTALSILWRSYILSTCWVLYSGEVPLSELEQQAHN
jgi:hypothetical protein